MSNPKNVDLTEDRLFFLGTGLLYRCVCAPKAWSAEQVEDRVSSEDPPGTSLNRWCVATPEERDDDFNGVSSLQCPDDANRFHWLMNC